MEDLAQRMASFRASDEAREQLFTDILNQHERLLQEHKDLKNDYLVERDSRRRYQDGVEVQQHVVVEYRRQFENSSFVLALIDGDGAIFQDVLLQAAIGDGGSEAASRLHHAIRDHIASLYNNSGHWPIMVHIYLSLDKLAQKLSQVGLLRMPQELRTFAQHFSVNQPLFSIIDVGHGKERADHKIKEMLRTFSDNPTCRHIVFGGCHDAGYLLNLEHFKHNVSKAGRITLLETTPPCRGFTELVNFRRARFDDVFKSEPLPDQAPPTSTFVTSPVQPSMQPLSPSITRNISPTGTPRHSAVPPSPSTTPAPTESSEDSSWASVGKTNVAANTSISIAPKASDKKESKNKKWAYYNKAGERLDLPLPPRDPTATESLERRMKKIGKKMCNHWHIGGHCDNGKFCHFQHEPKLTPGELNALRYKARSLACQNRYCENIDCYLGHQCALERDRGYCPYPENCHLRGRHGMDTQKHVRYDKDGNEEIAP